MKKLEKIYEGKAKILYTTEDPGLLIQYFKDDATAFNAALDALSAAALASKVSVPSAPANPTPAA